ncbi:LIM domain-containing protein jub-like isoform X2 [Tachypleus tridentatus]|uniref:LIM domain-containing protein jub-like isoform X2 n=1 Tax=Tachypleus tridentatus TaxID=6853 RepID=UPI003FD55DCB
MATAGSRTLLMLGQCVNFNIRKTVKVSVMRMELNPHLLKHFKERSDFYAYDPEEKCKPGDYVLIRDFAMHVVKRLREWDKHAKLWETSTILNVLSAVHVYSGYQQTAEKCAVCDHMIMELILQAMGKSFHPGCFRCCVCNEGLSGEPFTVDLDNKAYCLRDYYKVFARKCSACGKSITPKEGTDETVRVVAMDKDFHQQCFVCEDCGTQLSNEPGKRCYPIENHLLCQKCHLRKTETKS